MACVYGAAIEWSGAQGVILGFNLVPVGFRSPAASWTFTVANGVLVAAALLLLVRPGGGRIAPLASAAAVVGAGVLVAIATGPSASSADVLPYWQQISFFLSRSGAAVVFATVSAGIAASRIAQRSRGASRASGALGAS